MKVRLRRPWRPAQSLSPNPAVRQADSSRPGARMVAALLGLQVAQENHLFARVKSTCGRGGRLGGWYVKTNPRGHTECFESVVRQGPLDQTRRECRYYLRASAQMTTTEDENFKRTRQLSSSSLKGSWKRCAPDSRVLAVY